MMKYGTILKSTFLSVCFTPYFQLYLRFGYDVSSEITRVLALTGGVFSKIVLFCSSYSTVISAIALLNFFQKQWYSHVGDRVYDAQWSPCGNYIACKSGKDAIFLIDFRTRDISCVANVYQGMIKYKEIIMDLFAIY